MPAELIVFEGIDGSGKTTLSRMFLEYLHRRGTPAVWLREPTDGPGGRRIRELAAAHESLPPRQELELFLEDRRWDVQENILPALQSGQTVVLDRYFYSNACYQGARGLDMAEILRLNLEFAPPADHIFLIDVTVETALERIRRNREETVRLFEKKDFLEQVRANYLRLAAPGLIRIDGMGTLDQVLARIVARYEAAG